MKKVLVFAPHPDDDIIACGGSIAKHIQNGNSVSIVYISSGEAGSLSSTPEALADIREEEARRAAGLLGVDDLLFLRLADGYISFERKALEDLVRLIRNKKPDWVYLPHEAESVRDHRQTHDLVMEACKRAAGPWFGDCGRDIWSVETILAYEVWTPLQNVAVTVDVTDFMSQKLAALRAHQSQLTDIAYDQAVEGLNRYRGITSGAGKYCECFQVIKTR